MKKTQIETLIDEAQELAADRDPRGVAQDLVKGLPEAFLRRIAVQFIVERLRQRGRHVTLLAERRAMRDQLMRELSPASPSGPGYSVGPLVRTPEEQAELDEIGYRAMARLMADSKAATERYISEMRIEWTNELLNSAFALADGTLILWGDATVEQHRERVGIFTRNAAANLEGAARHEAAIRSLEQSGAQTLRQMVDAA